MVVKRIWGCDTGSRPGSLLSTVDTVEDENSSSNDSDISNLTFASSNSSGSQFSKFNVSSPESEEEKPVPSKKSDVGETTLKQLKQRLGVPLLDSDVTANDSAMYSLELLRICVQSAFDKQVNIVVKKFLEQYFKPAFKNIRKTLGQSSVSADVLQKMSCALLENSKGQYNGLHPMYSNCHMHFRLPDTEERPVQARTRRLTGKSQVANNSTSYHTPKRQPIVNKKPRQKSTKVTQSTLNQHDTPSTTTSQSSVRRQIVWNTDNISISTRFVLDVQANQAFGFKPGDKDRLANKHPELVRYLPDAKDRNWLISQNIITSVNHNSRILLLIYDEVLRLKRTHPLYRNSSHFNPNIMRSFTVPDFIIQKMKSFFIDLNVKSRGMITNSLLMNNSPSNSSQLRNALLQGPGVDHTLKSNRTEVHSTSNKYIRNPSSSGNCSVSSRTRASTLSSSHITLTALLNNSTLSVERVPLTKTQSRKL